MPIEDIMQWVGKEILDSTGAKVGKLVDVYFDATTDQPAFLVADTGRRTPTVLVPAWNAVTSPDHIQVPYDQAAMAGAPTVSFPAGMKPEDEPEAFTYYRAEHQPTELPGGRRLIRH